MPRSAATAHGLFMRCVDPPAIDAVLRDKEQLLSAALTVATADDIKQLFLEFQERRRDVLSNAEDRAVGRAEFHRARCGRLTCCCLPDPPDSEQLGAKKNPGDEPGVLHSFFTLQECEARSRLILPRHDLLALLAELVHRQA